MKLTRLTKNVLVMLVTAGLFFAGTSSMANAATPPATSSSSAATSIEVATPSPDDQSGVEMVQGEASPMDVAGQYYYFCIWFNGVSYNWNGNNPTDCQGYLDVYINGSHVAHLQNGGRYVPSMSCQIGIATQIVSIFIPGFGASSWAVAGWLWNSWVVGLGCDGN